MDAQPSPLTLSPGRYRLDERVPHSRRGRWRLDDVICNGQVLPNPQEAEVTITGGAGATCTFVNSFEASGEIQIEKVTLGGVTTTGFVIWPVGDPETRYRKFATTERPGEPARPRAPKPDALPLGAYVIQELEPAPPARRNWSLVEVVCNGRTLPAIEGRVVVRLTRDQPLERCRFTNSFVDVPVPVIHRDRITFRAARPRSGGEQDRRPAKGHGRRGGHLQGQVSNIGDATAEGVVVADVASKGASLVSARVRRTGCQTAPVLYCSIAKIRPGRTTTSKIRMRMTRPGISRNVAVVYTDSRSAATATMSRRPECGWAACRRSA